ncbi:NTP transferase domain-containing protein [Sphingobium fluviale]|uniref:4-diphosphocytidyl-2C-methyl-D-erythritol synthase n=1 Tax=Sphingobium fluviale TaxID=2506423 RepID=A0A4Q1KN70_9SPHN|nr:NTP transferase domain-containing protein [Sphingobium fluviale]RXR30264.1 4-diphosphocytidyl-2C-methyl-D-erythritol synthase [Sphingobium fluviale]
MNDRSLTAILLAGSRPGADPLASAAGIAWKALVPISGRPMIDYVARALIAHPRIGRIIVMAQQPEELVADPQTAWMAKHAAITLYASGAGISQSLLEWMESEPDSLPVLVTTADNVLLDARVIDAFLAGVGDADIAAGMVERTTLMRAYPESRRTWLKSRGGAWSGANLFWLGGVNAKHALQKWRAIEQDRKKGWKIALALGPLLLLGAGLRVLSIHAGIARAGRALGVNARVVPLPFAEACIDADKPEDVTLIERILARRGGP